MADYGIFIGWGSARPGREAGAVQLFQEALDYWNGLKTSGEIDDLDFVILSPHGGDLTGFVLLQGDAERLARLRMSPEFRQLSMRAGLYLDRVGIVDAMVNGGVIATMQQWRDSIAGLA